MKKEILVTRLLQFSRRVGRGMNEFGRDLDIKRIPPERKMEPKSKYKKVHPHTMNNYIVLTNNTFIKVTRK